MSKVKTITVTNTSVTPNTTETIPAAISQIYYNEKNNLCIETTTDDIVNNKGGKINLESVSDIQVKPADDLILYSSHRPTDKLNEVSVKVTDGDDVPVKLQLNASEMLLTTKDKTGSDANVMDITVNSAKNTRGYLKVRAQAIDLRSESHGGIALQPKGKDSDGNMNKIKFEHGGGDGLEFGTFNTEKTSLFTTEYRFNKAGEVKMATRTTVASDKADATDPTTANKYVKQADDFYDIIDANDKKTTWQAIIEAGNAFEDSKIKLDDRLQITSEAEVTKKGNVKGYNTTIVASIKNNLPATYAELVANEGTITEAEYNTLKTNWNGVTTQAQVSCTVYDMVKLVNWMKTNNQGPWASASTPAA